VAARTAFNLHFIFDDGKAPNRGSPATICYAPPECNAPNHSTPGQSARPHNRISSARYLARAMEAIATTSPNHGPFTVFQKAPGHNVELTGRRATNQASESRERKTTLLRSGPTICSAAPT